MLSKGPYKIRFLVSECSQPGKSSQQKKTARIQMQENENPEITFSLHF